jgi:hypothetical protein
VRLRGPEHRGRTGDVSHPRPERAWYPSPLGAKWRIGNLRNLLLRKRYVAFDAEGHPADCPRLKNPEGNGTLVHRGIEHRAVCPAFVTAVQMLSFAARQRLRFVA